eukprot:17021-Heterococcus_DN1.PRE.2
MGKRDSSARVHCCYETATLLEKSSSSASQKLSRCPLQTHAVPGDAGFRIKNVVAAAAAAAASSASCVCPQEGLLSADEIEENALAPRDVGEGVFTAATAAAAGAAAAAVATVTGEALPDENVLEERGGVAFATLRATLRAAAEGGDVEFSLS